MTEGTRVGTVLASKYRLEELLGSGGMGHVYRAVNEDVGRVVAIKVLRAEHATNGPIVERFLREAKAANLVRHPNVVDVLDIGRDGDGSPFIVQELLKGEDLAKYVERRGGKLTLAEIEDILLPVIDAVAEAHARGVVHRDIKPENVFLAEEGKRRVPKLLDFGISKIRLPDIRVTEVGVMMGTPAYMAPEQIQGSRDADPRTDVWALGIMLFELLSGRLPFEEAVDAPALFVAIATKDVPRLGDVCPEVTPEVSRIAERCLRRMPDDRYPTALELARDFRHVLEGTEIEPTQKRSLPPAAMAIVQLAVPDLIPDLAFPAPRALTKEFELRPEQKKKGLSGELPAVVPPVVPSLQQGASPTIVGIGLNKTELSIAKPSPGIPSLPDPPNAASPTLDLPAPSAATSRAPVVRTPDAAPSASRDGPSSGKPQSIGRDEAFEGVMLTAVTSPSRRGPPIAGMAPDSQRQQRQQLPQDLSVLVGLSVVGLTSIGATAVLMTFAHQPDGFQLVQLVTKPTPLISLVVQGGFGVAGLVIAAKCAIGAVKRWRGEIEGGHASAIFFAVVAGAFFFAAIELARAAW